MEVNTLRAIVEVKSRKQNRKSDDPDDPAAFYSKMPYLPPKKTALVPKGRLSTYFRARSSRTSSSCGSAFIAMQSSESRLLRAQVSNLRSPVERPLCRSRAVRLLMTSATALLRNFSKNFRTSCVSHTPGAASMP